MENINKNEFEQLEEFLNLIRGKIYSNEANKVHIINLWNKYFPQDSLPKDEKEINFLKAKNILLDFLTQNITNRYDGN